MTRYENPRLTKRVLTREAKEVIWGTGFTAVPLLVAIALTIVWLSSEMTTVDTGLCIFLTWVFCVPAAFGAFSLGAQAACIQWTREVEVQR